MAAMPPSVQEYGKIVYLFLSQVLEGKALQKARSVPRGHGLELWRLMKQDYEGANGGRGTAVLIGLLTPTFEQECVSRPFLEVLADWEVRVQRYEEQTGEVVSGAQRVAVLARWAPAALKAVVRQHLPQAGTNYARLRNDLTTYIVTGAEYDASGAAIHGPGIPENCNMQVDVIGQGGKTGGQKPRKGDRKGADRKGGERKGDHRPHADGKTKKTGKGSEWEDMDCHFCGKKGHRKAN